MTFIRLAVVVALVAVVTAVSSEHPPLEVFRHEASRLNHAGNLHNIPAGFPVTPLRFNKQSKTNRPPRFVPQPQTHLQQKVLRLAVLAPSDPHHQFSLSKILPAITLAARTIERAGNKQGSATLLAGWRVQIVDRDSKCSSTYGPLEAFDLYNNKAIGSLLLLLEAKLAFWR